MPRKHPDPDIDAKIVALRKEGRKTREIIAALKVNAARVTRVLADHGIGSDKTSEETRKLIFGMHEVGTINAEIARTLGVSKTTVANVLRNGIVRAPALKASEAIRIEDDIAYVPLSKGKEVVIDAADVEMVAKWGKWSASNPNRNRTKFYAYGCMGGIRMLMHRLIMNAQDGDVVDHINGNTLDNRRSNLRITDMRGNANNQEGHRNGSMPGTRPDKAGTWAFDITFYKSGFPTQEAAYEAKLQLIEKLHKLADGGCG